VRKDSIESLDKLFTMKQVAVFLALVALVAAHGFVQNATIGGKEYDGTKPPIQLCLTKSLTIL
jgi:hypothetical protein